MHEYKATLIRVVDGDTVWLEVDLGFRITMKVDFRLYGIDAPERYGIKADPEAAERSKKYLELLLAPLPIGRPQALTIKTYKPDKYGRWLADIWTEDGNSVNNLMLLTGNAVQYNP